MTRSFFGVLFGFEHSGPETINSLTQIDPDLLRESPYIPNSYFIKSWQQVQGHDYFHLFYNHKQQAFWALLQDLKATELIPPTQGAFQLIKVPLLECENGRKKITQLINCPASSSLLINFIEVLKRELRHPVIQGTTGCYSIEIKSRGLLGGGAKVSKTVPFCAIKQETVEKGGLKYFREVQEYLVENYQIAADAGDTNDKRLVEGLARQICEVLPSDQYSTISNHLFQNLPAYEGEFLSNAVLKVLGKSRKDGNPTLTDYTRNFEGGILSIELLRKGFFASQRAKGGIDQIIIDRVLTKLEDDIKPLITKVEQSTKATAKGQPGDGLERYFVILEKKEKAQNIMKTVSKSRVKKMLVLIKERLKTDSDEEQDIIDELCLSADFDEILNHLIVKFSMTSKTSMLLNPLRGQSLDASLKSNIINLKNSSSQIGEVSSASSSPTKKGFVGKLRQTINESESPKEENELQDLSYLDKVHLSVLSEMTMLDHDLNTLVQLFNMLKIDQDVKNQGLDIEEAKENFAKNAKLNDIKSLLMAMVRTYREDEENLDLTEISLLPLSFVQDKDVFRAFLEAFLADLKTDILLEPKKIRMLSFILINAMRNKDFSKFCQVDDLIQCLRIIIPKIEDLSITSENLNLQEVMNSLNDILYLMGFIGAKGIKGEYAELIIDLTHHMQSHSLEKAFNMVSGTAKDNSLEVKREYAVEAFKRIEGTSFEEWTSRLETIMQVTQIAIGIGKGVFTSNIADITNALLQAKDLLLNAYLEIPKTWYDDANNLRFLAAEPMEKILNQLFDQSRSSLNTYYVFFVAEFLLNLVNHPERKLQEKKLAIQALWLLSHGYDYRESNSPVKSKAYRSDRDIILYVKKNLLTIGQNSNIDLNIFIRKIVEGPLRLDPIKVIPNDPLSAPKIQLDMNQDDSVSKKFYLRVLREKTPKLYALANIQEHSEKTLEKPAVLVGYRVVERERDMDDAFKTKLVELMANTPPTNLDAGLQQIKALDAKTTTKKKLLKVVETVSERQEGLPQKKETEEEKKMNTEKRQSLQSELTTKVEEIMNANTHEIFGILENFLDDPLKRVLVIQGDAGAGKTMLVRLFEQRLWKRYNISLKADVKNRGRLPLRIVLSEVRSLKTAIDDFLIQHGCNSEGLGEIKKRPTAILFDGYDEINQWVNLYNLNNLHFWKDVKVIFTSRKENLTALKDDFIYCFTPGRDVSKVESYIVQPVNEEQIRQYFSAQGAENESEASELEKKLKELKRNKSSFSPITGIVTKEVDYFAGFVQSEEYSCICSILNWLEQHTEDIQQIEDEIGAIQDENLLRIPLIETLSKRVDALRSLADKDRVNSIHDKIKQKLPSISKIETFLDEIMRNPDFSYQTRTEIIKLDKPMAAPKAFRVLEKILENLCMYTHVGLALGEGNTEWLDLVTSRANKTYFEETCELLRNVVKVGQELANRMKTDKNLNIPEDMKLLDVTKMNTFIGEIEAFADFEKMEKTIKQLRELVAGCQTIQTEYEALIQEIETPEIFVQDQARLKVQFDKCKACLAEIRKQLEKLQAVTPDLLFTSLNSPWEATLNWEYEFYSLYNDEKMMTPEFTDLKSQFESASQALADRLPEFAVFITTEYLDAVNMRITQEDCALDETFTRRATKTLINIMKEINQDTEVLINFRAENKRGSRLVQALTDQTSKLTALNHDYQFSEIIHRLEEMTSELKILDTEAMAIRPEVTEETLKMINLSKQIADLKRFSDPNSVDAIIRKFKDVVSSPFMLRMLAQTLIKHPKSLANKAELYHLFSNIHFEREKERLIKTESIPSKFNIMDSFYQYSKDLAVNMFIRKITSLQVKSSGYKTLGIQEQKKKNIWSRFFDDTDIITKLSRHGAQIIEDDGVVRFTHKSIMEYFAARQFYDEIVDYNPDSPDDFEPCLNKGPIIDNETAVYQFMKYISDSQLKKDETLTVFDKKLFEILSSTGVQKLYKTDLEQNFLFLNIFLILLLRGNTKSKINELREGSSVTGVLNGILNWVFNPPQESLRSSQKFLKMIDQALAANSQAVSILEQILPLYYHSVTSQSSVGDKFTIEKKATKVKVRLCPQYSESSFVIKDDKIVEEEASQNFFWILDAKLFLHGSQESIVVLNTERSNQCFSLDTTKKSSQIQPEILTDFTVSDAKAAWSVMECKWILRMNENERINFQLISVADPTKTLCGRFQKIEDYKSLFVDLCSCDIHTCSVSDFSYQCITCGLDKGGNIVCKSCVDICHKGHEITEYGQSGGYCDCRFVGVCKIALGCTERFGSGYANHVMFKCTQCPNAQRNTILCNGCKVHHQKDTQHQDFEKVMESGNCECNCISNKTQVIAKTQVTNYYYEEENIFQNVESDSDPEDEHKN